MIWRSLPKISEVNMMSFFIEGISLIMEILYMRWWAFLGNVQTKFCNKRKFYKLNLQKEFLLALISPKKDDLLFYPILFQGAKPILSQILLTQITISFNRRCGSESNSTDRKRLQVMKIAGVKCCVCKEITYKVLCAIIRPNMLFRRSLSS